MNAASCKKGSTKRGRKENLSNNNIKSACKEQRRNIKGKKMRDHLASLK
jgi:hypothetical protein